MKTLLAHNGEDHGTTESAVTEEHEDGHVQASTTQQTPAPSANSSSSSNLPLVGGIVVAVLVAGVAAWMLLKRNKQPQSAPVSSEDE
jgi:LPXTG-motif cell wall-anchored protein